MLKNAFQIDKLAVRWFSVEKSIAFYTWNKEKFYRMHTTQNDFQIL